MAQWVKAFAAQAWQPEFHPWDQLSRRREPAPTSCPLIPTCTLACMNVLTCVHACECTCACPINKQNTCVSVKETCTVAVLLPSHGRAYSGPQNYSCSFWFGLFLSFLSFLVHVWLCDWPLLFLFFHPSCS